MPRVGYKNAKYNQIDYDSKKYKALTDSKIPQLKRVIDEKFSEEKNSAELYADDVLAETDYSFKKGTLTITVADDEDTVAAEFLGNKITEDEVIKNVSDTAPEFGYGHIVTKLKNGIKKFKVEFFPRVKFNKINTDAKTRGQSMEFGTTTIEGTVLPLEEAINGMSAGDWERHKTFDTEPEAKQYLDNLLTPYTQPAAAE